VPLALGVVPLLDALVVVVLGVAPLVVEELLAGVEVVLVPAVVVELGVLEVELGVVLVGELEVGLVAVTGAS
jgi:hypothetical protein